MQRHLISNLHRFQPLDYVEIRGYCTEAQIRYHRIFQCMLLSLHQRRRPFAQQKSAANLTSETEPRAIVLG
jgi:hypothetical protein